MKKRIIRKGSVYQEAITCPECECIGKVTVNHYQGGDIVTVTCECTCGCIWESDL